MTPSAPAPEEDPLGPEWATAADGTRTRSAARVVVLDGASRVLLVRGGDPAVPGSRWWFTPGGGIAAGESPAEAAARELAEETGIAVAPAALTGPVLRRAPVFEWLGRSCRQEELFYLARLPSPPRLSRAGWTALERATLDDVRWWAAGELAVTADDVYPPSLAEHVERLGRGWDGRLLQVD
ncbi:ADP-ribose pyrophosphatase YjhB (NUDIX family) [Kineococcus xinjiangensis]|uniref:ADP-ribose pyrophosphatase YjhB (NUDIX family) n=1 Tax=Kineococcus xinjiangensis TaxID=512762 RepID=A0A2S6IP09_9ACTN|nr:NUDIX domain-containing protein [Kineococcus xinjiangensis]PPK95959.1 ADP-ribose pyrophosphatase YjhB (NUDIX family) [Kineococcus xinjiangensis]